MRRLCMARLSLAVLLLVGAQAGGSQADAYRPGGATSSVYHWPVKPFRGQHPIQAVFGDPRTVYPLQPFGRTGPKREGAYSLHNGVDISANAGTPVYPVVSGRITAARPNEIVVQTVDGRTFQYYHLDRAVQVGQRVVAERTILGRVRENHVHLAEIDRHRVQNPLETGHLAPYRDRTKPLAVGLYIDNGGGPRPLVAGHVGARDRLVVAANDPPARPLLAPYSELPQVPALVEWRLLRGGSHSTWKIAADFRGPGPSPRAFWQIYAPGTYQNCPVFEHRLFSATPGRYLFRLGLDSSRLGSGSYRLETRVTDIRHNSSVASWPVRIVG